MRPYRSSVKAEDFSAETRAFFAGKRVLVTGGGGFIGSHVVEQMLVLGARPVVPTRKGVAPFIAHLGGEVALIKADLREANQARAACQDTDAILHLAADIGGLAYNIAHPASIFDNNMRLGLNVLAAAASRNVGRVLLCSSACVYPRHCSIPTPESEGFVGEPEPTNAGYGWSKRMLEFLGAQYQMERGLSVAIVRPYNAYGPRDTFDPERSHVIAALIRKAVESRDGILEVWGSGAASRSFVYVDDFARGLVEAAARHPGADVLNIGADEEISIADLAAMIAQLTGAATGRTLRLAFQPDAPAGQPRRRCDTTKARQAIGFEAKVSMHDGLRRTIAWYLAQ